MSLQSSLLSAPALAALRAADLEPVGQVMGCIVMQLGWGWFGCGASGTSSYLSGANSPVRSSARVDVANAATIYHSYDTALSRMLTEAGAGQADGVVGVELRWSRIGQARELVALGTAVRHRNPAARRAASTSPWCTELTGEDVAKARLAGWTPLGIAVGLAVTVKHEDRLTRQQTTPWGLGGGGTGNVEVAGLTELIATARHDARDKLAERAAGFAGAAHVVVSELGLEVTERECGDQQRDHLAEARYVGTVLARSQPAPDGREPVSSLSIMPLTNDPDQPGGTT